MKRLGESTYKPFWSSLIKFYQVYSWWQKLITGSVFLTLTHSPTYTHKIHSFQVFFLCLVLVLPFVYFCLFLFLFSVLFPISDFSCKFLYLPIVPWSHFGGLQPITQIIFFVQVVGFRRWCKFFFRFATISKGCIFSIFVIWGCQILCSRRIISRPDYYVGFFCELVVQFVTYNFLIFFFDFMGGTILWAILVRL